METGDDGVAKVTFMYRYQAGACPKSYGLHVANLAKLPASIVARAKQKSEEFEAAVEAAEAVASRPLSAGGILAAARALVGKGEASATVVVQDAGGDDDEGVQAEADAELTRLYNAARAL